MSGISTHVLDLASGRPAGGVAVRLERERGAAGWVEIGAATTDRDGRARELAPAPIEAGAYRLTFETGAYFLEQGTTAYHPRIVVTFVVADPEQSHHVPLLVAPFGYSTYRGS